MRHGEGFHNVAGAANEQEYLNPRWLDAHLTTVGWQQAAALRRHIQGLPGFRADLVVVSPLTRTLETAAGVFGGGPINADASAGEAGAAAATAASGTDAPMLMTAQTEIPVSPEERRRRLSALYIMLTGQHALRWGLCCCVEGHRAPGCLPAFD